MIKSIESGQPVDVITVPRGMAPNWRACCIERPSRSLVAATRVSPENNVRRITAEAVRADC